MDRDHSIFLEKLSWNDGIHEGEIYIFHYFKVDTGERDTPAVLLQKKGSIAFTNGTRKVHTSDTRDGKYYKVQMDKGKRPVLLIQINGWE